MSGACLRHVCGMSEAHLLPWAGVMTLPACYSGAGAHCSPACLKFGEIQCYSVAGKGLGRQEGLHPLAAIQKKAAASLHASPGAHRELGGGGGLGSSGRPPVAPMGGSESSLLMSYPVGRWALACPSGAGVLPELQALISRADAALAHGCSPGAAGKLGSASQLHQPKKGWGGV